MKISLNKYENIKNKVCKQRKIKKLIENILINKYSLKFIFFHKILIKNLIVVNLSLIVKCLKIIEKKLSFY